MVFIISRVVHGLNERKGWYAFNISDQKTIVDVYNDFVGLKLFKVLQYRTYKLLELQLISDITSKSWAPKLTQV